MSNHNPHYRDPDFNAANTGDYILLLQIRSSSLSYAVIIENKVLVLEENINNNELNNPSEEHGILFANYKERIIGLPQKGFTFVPVSLFKPDRVADFARFLDVKTNEKIFSQLLDADNQVIYKVDESVADMVSDKFDVNNTVFAAKGWVKAIAANSPSNNDLYINIHNDQAEFLNFKDDKLRFYNSFEFKNTDELVYFSLFVAEELKLQFKNTTLILSGDLTADDENSSRLTKFFSKVELNHLKTVDLPWEIKSPAVLMLTALSLCGSSEAL